ncbi:FtsW/RodA/SpoVE family cell cycle protein [Macrococcus armenti]|uniref:FtsW/RodA/SpoVE family cell cycle protein n=1 Tax=Macrococcus armenti TaxID=2875764 RepID=UPI001CCDD576|nr:FtsW/RodA/SpoVE family cell cycle protein [Macrococcus armenti]UBH16186.1 FtsW/RodA/SpoVE family cell cycle protein [Macrococcus armenti]UBH18546.1 FtsW/RodA/SpoVE family cell cycle protein [Macrococcus armenti]UBH20813.1 FtsW/RodA/SpoVE family cell cycle protein [Macrococcus armenti]
MIYLKRFFRYVKDNTKYVDFPLLITYVVLALIGLVMVYSASMVAATRGTLTGGTPVSANYFYIRQLFAIILSFGIVFVMTYFMSINLLYNRRLQQYAIFGIMALLILTRIFGREVNGAKSWLPLGFMQLQTSELLKLVVIIYLAYIYNKKRNLDKLSVDIIAPLILVGLCSGLVLMQNDLGSTLLILMIVGSIFLYSGIAIKTVLKMGGIIFGGLITAALFSFGTGLTNFLGAHQKQRFEVLANPFADESGAGYHLSNSLLAIGNGGIFGKGLGNGVMKLGYLPEPHTDFIFAVIAEELGLVGVLVIICLLLFIVFKGFIYAATARTMFHKLICVGVSSYIGIQTFINLGGISGLIPLTGVPLPFLSYGGSSLMSLSIAVGLLLMTSKDIKRDNERRTS